MFDTPAQIQQAAQRILTQTVVSKVMPLGNETGMTEEDRHRLGAWLIKQRGE